MDIAALKTELALLHAVTGEYNSDNVLAAAELNAKNLTRIRALSMTEVREWSGVGARAFKIRQGITTSSTDQIKSLCIIADAILSTDDSKLDPDNPLHVGMISELVSGGVLSTGDRTALITKATESISRATKLGLGTVKAGHVEEARR